MGISVDLSRIKWRFEYHTNSLSVSFPNYEKFQNSFRSILSFIVERGFMTLGTLLAVE